MNQDVNQAMVQEVSQEESLEQIVASSPNYRTEEEAFAIANGISEEEAIALAASAEYSANRPQERAAVAGAFREEFGHAMEPGAKVMSADKELRFCLELQRDRLARKNIRYKEELDPGKKPLGTTVLTAVLLAARSSGEKLFEGAERTLFAGLRIGFFPGSNSSLYRIFFLARRSL